MTRQEWQDFTHKIRSDARAFKERHGGFPCFTRHFWHNGIEWSITRVRNDGVRWQTFIRPSLIRERETRGRIFDEIDTAADHRRAMRRAPWTKSTHKRGIRLAVEIARALRMEAA